MAAAGVRRLGPAASGTRTPALEQEPHPHAAFGAATERTLNDEGHSTLLFGAPSLWLNKRTDEPPQALDLSQRARAPENGAGPVLTPALVLLPLRVVRPDEHRCRT
jgi:hypothetical protein